MRTYRAYCPTQGETENDAILVKGKSQRPAVEDFMRRRGWDREEDRPDDKEVRVILLDDDDNAEHEWDMIQRVRDVPADPQSCATCKWFTVEPEPYTPYCAFVPSCDLPFWSCELAEDSARRSVAATDGADCSAWEPK